MSLNVANGKTITHTHTLEEFLSYLLDLELTPNLTMLIISNSDVLNVLILVHIFKTLCCKTSKVLSFVLRLSE